MNTNQQSELKLLKLKGILNEYKSVVIAFSGGTDSTYLLHCASQVPGLRVIALTIKTPYVPGWEMREAVEFCHENNIAHRLIELPFPEIVRDNPLERCYLCKKSLFNKVLNFASANGYNHVADGTNADDAGDFRPGLRALSELNIKSPLMESGLTKNEIRALSEKEGLPTWNKPPYACLLTRIPYKTTVSESILSRIEEAETYIKEIGFPGTRVRINGDEARLECQPQFLGNIMDASNRALIIKRLKEIGFIFISVDLEVL